MHGCFAVRLCCAIVAAAATGALATPASALTARVSSGVLVVEAAPSEENDLYVTQSGMTVKVLDQGFRNGVPGDWITPTAGSGCTAVAPVEHADGSLTLGYVTCPAIGFNRVQVTLGDRRGAFKAFYGDWNNGAPRSDGDLLQFPLSVTAGAQGARITGTLAAPNRLDGGPVGSEMYGGLYDDVMLGGEHDDRMAGAGGDDDLQGRGGADVLDGGAGADHLSGGAGPDFVVAEAGHADRLDAGGDDGDGCALTNPNGQGVAVSLDGIVNDGPRTETRLGDVRGCQRLTGTDGPDILVGTSGDDILNADQYDESTDLRADVVQGLGGHDEINNPAGAAILEGGPGDDRFLTGTGDDDVRGGTGVDTVQYEGWTTGRPSIVADLDGASRDDGRAAIGEHDTLGADLENLFGKDGDDVLIGNAADNVLEGRGGLDDYDGKGGRDQAVLSWSRAMEVRLDLDLAFSKRYDDLPDAETDLISIEDVVGGSGDDLIVGTDGEHNRISGGQGNDVIDGGTGPDVIDGGDGWADAVSYEERTEPVTVDLSTSGPIAGAAGEGDTLSFVEDVFGGAGADTLIGDARWNLLSGGPGADTLNPGEGEDEVYGDEGLDLISTRDTFEDAVDCGPDGATVDADDDDLLEETCPEDDEVQAQPPSQQTPVSPGSPTPHPTRPTRPTVFPTRPLPFTPTPSGSGTRLGRYVAPKLRAPRVVTRRALRRGRMTVSLRCPTECSIRLAGYPDGGGARLFSGRATADAGTWVTVPVRVTKAGRRAGRRVRALSLEIVVSDSARRTDMIQRTVRVKPG